MSENKRRSFFFGLSRSNGESNTDLPQPKNTHKANNPFDKPVKMNSKLSSAKNTNPFVKENIDRLQQNSNNSFKTFKVTRVDDAKQEFQKIDHTANDTEEPQQNTESFKPALNRSSSSTYTTYTMRKRNAIDLSKNTPDLPDISRNGTLDPTSISRQRPLPPPVDMKYIRNLSSKSDNTIVSTGSVSSSHYTDTPTNPSELSDQSFQFPSKRIVPNTQNGTQPNRVRYTSNHSEFSNGSSLLDTQHKRERSQVEIYIDQLDLYMENEDSNNTIDTDQINTSTDDDYASSSAHNIKSVPLTPSLDPLTLGSPSKSEESSLQDEPLDYDYYYNHSNNDGISSLRSEAYSDKSNNLSQNSTHDNSGNTSPIKPLYNKKSIDASFLDKVAETKMPHQFYDSESQSYSYDTARSSETVSRSNTAPYKSSSESSPIEGNSFLNNNHYNEGPNASDNRPLYPTPLILTSTNSSGECNEYDNEDDDYSFNQSIKNTRTPTKHESVKEIQNVSSFPGASDVSSQKYDEAPQLRVINQDKPSFFVDHSGDEDEDGHGNIYKGDSINKYEGSLDTGDDHSSNIENSRPAYRDTYNDNFESPESKSHKNNMHPLDASSALHNSTHFESHSDFDTSSSIGQSVSSSHPLNIGSDQGLTNPGMGSARSSTKNCNVSSSRINRVPSMKQSSSCSGYSSSSFEQTAVSGVKPFDTNPIFADEVVPYLAERSFDQTQVKQADLSAASESNRGEILPVGENTVDLEPPIKKREHKPPVNRSGTVSTGVLRDSGKKVTLVSNYIEEIRYRYFPTANILQPPPNLPFFLKSKDTLELPQNNSIRVNIRTSSQQIGIKHGKAKQKLLSLEAPAEEDEYNEHPNSPEDGHMNQINNNSGYIPTVEEEEEQMVLKGIPGNEAYDSDDMMAPLREKRTTKKSKTRVDRSDSTKSYFTKNVHRFRSGTLDNSYIPPMGNLHVPDLPELRNNQSIPLYNDFNTNVSKDARPASSSETDENYDSASTKPDASAMPLRATKTVGTDGDTIFEQPQVPKRTLSAENNLKIINPDNY